MNPAAGQFSSLSDLMAFTRTLTHCQIRSSTSLSRRSRSSCDHRESSSHQQLTDHNSNTPRTCTSTFPSVPWRSFSFFSQDVSTAVLNCVCVGVLDDESVTCSVGSIRANCGSCREMSSGVDSPPSSSLRPPMILIRAFKAYGTKYIRNFLSFPKSETHRHQTRRIQLRQHERRTQMIYLSSEHHKQA